MRYSRLWLLPLIAVLILAGCADVPYKTGYPAKGEGDRVAKLEKVNTFTPTDDLKLVLEFNAHTRAIELTIEWENPEGATLERFAISVPADAETMVVDYQLAKSGLDYWMPGEWQAKVRISENLVDTIPFSVIGENPAENPDNPFGQ